jgi:DNA-directed RNA polymerase subunit H (RpoH/RPB5)
MQRLFDIKKTQLEMVRDRGYELSPEEAQILTMNLTQFYDYVNRLAANNAKTTTRSLLSRSYLAKLPDGTTRSMLVYYGGKTNPQQKQVSADVVRDFISLVERYRINEAILIVDAPLSSTGDNELSALTLTKWQVFYDSELTYNPTTHVDTPKQYLLSPEETQEKLRELKADLSKLLILKVNDPVVRYYGWTAGNLVRVHRDDQSVSILAPKSINYRVIVS